jgi:predicted amidophosphoribosyltransferase
MVDENAARCAACGAEFELTCPACGKAVSPTDEVCPACGGVFET